MSILRVVREIDQEISPLVEELNRVGIETFASCAGHDGVPGYIAIRLDSLAGIRVERGNLVIDIKPIKDRKEQKNA